MPITATDPDYRTYLPPSAELVETWGVGVTAAGHTRVRPGSTYPAGRHPADHALSWTTGRVLGRGGFQVVYISQGAGVLEADQAGRADIGAGTVFQLFPGVWHRYRPDASDGWTEDWLELRGPAIDRLADRGVLRADRPVCRIGHSPPVLDLFRRCHHLARAQPVGFQPLLGTLGLELLAQVLPIDPAASGATVGPTSARDDVERARSLIAGRLSDPLSMEQVADEVGMGYTTFRRAFRAHLGVTPKQYHLRLRLQRAEDQLANTDRPLKAIAAHLGFDSPSHLSADFKARTGVSPTAWRHRARGYGGSAPEATSAAAPGEATPVQCAPAPSGPPAASVATP